MASIKSIKNNSFSYKLIPDINLHFSTKKLYHNFSCFITQKVPNARKSRSPGKIRTQKKRIRHLLPDSLITSIFTSIFFRQFLPSSLHSVVYLHAHGCRKDNRSYGRSWSGCVSRIPGRHPSQAPDDRSRHNMPEKD